MAVSEVAEKSSFTARELERGKCALAIKKFGQKKTEPSSSVLLVVSDLIK